MTLLVDYRCTTCGTRAEHWVASPPPGSLPCPACDGTARRSWSPIGLSGASVVEEPRQRRLETTTTQSTDLCQQYPQIPALCMMTPSAQRRMVAAYTGDHRARDREIERQAAAAAERPPTMADAISHHHQPSGTAVSG